MQIDGRNVNVRFPLEDVAFTSLHVSHLCTSPFDLLVNPIIFPFLQMNDFVKMEC